VLGRLNRRMQHGQPGRDPFRNKVGDPRAPVGDIA
jgi:hypothetical protein